MPKGNIGSHLMMIAVNAMPFDFIIEKLEEAVKEYKLVPTEENKISLDAACHMYDLKNTIDHVGGLEVLLAKMEHLHQADSLLKVKDNSN